MTFAGLNKKLNNCETHKDAHNSCFQRTMPINELGTTPYIEEFPLTKVSGAAPFFMPMIGRDEAMGNREGETEESYPLEICAMYLRKHGARRL